MSRELRKKLLITLAAVVVALFVAGGVAAYLSRNDTICSDGKAPVAQRGGSLGQMQYQCHDGELVTKP
jgi:hypothetical protein